MSAGMASPSDRHAVEVGQFLGRIPFVSFGSGTEPLVVINGGNAFG